MSDTATSQVVPLQVSAHLMALDPGLYCVFSVPGGPAPDSITGLPAVRITAAPGKQAGDIDLAGLDPGGWVGPEAAVLVRVGLMRSDLLVTVYQARDSKAEAPQLQVTRISAVDSAPAPGEAAPPPKANAPERMDVVAHVYGMGDVGNQLGEWAGVPGSKRWIEGFGIAPAGLPQGDIEYQAVLGRGWLSPWAPGGQFCGSRGMSLPILGLRVRLRGESARTHAVSLTASFVDGTKVGPVADGEACEAQSLAALEAFQVLIGPRTGSATTATRPAQAPAQTAPAPKTKAPKPPAPKAEAQKAPAAKIQVQRAPVQSAPVQKAPAQMAPAQKAKMPPLPTPKAKQTAEPVPAPVPVAARATKAKAATPPPAPVPVAPAKPARRKSSR